jgi:hypothetical protein
LDSTAVHTYYQTFHLILPHHFHAQCLFDLVIKFVCSTARRNDIQIVRASVLDIAISLPVLDGQAAHKLNTGIYAIGREFEEVKSAAKILGGFFKAPVANFD